MPGVPLTRDASLVDAVTPQKNDPAHSLHCFRFEGGGGKLCETDQAKPGSVFAQYPTLGATGFDEGPVYRASQTATTMQS